MLTLDEIKTQAQEEYARQAAKPSGSFKTHRSAGGVMLVLGIAVTVINILSWIMAGRLFIFLVAANIVLVAAGVYMLATGKNPFARLKR